jgi:ankyrin repeat protein
MLASPFCSSKILTHRHRKNLEFESPLFKAVKQEDLGLVELILNHPNANLSLLELTCFTPCPLFLAVKQGLSDIAKAIIASPHCTSEVLLQRFAYEASILNMAVERGQIEVVKTILANPQCTPNVLLRTPSLLFSTLDNRREITLAILQSKPMSSELLCATNSSGDTLLTLAAKRGDTEIVELICASPHCNTSLLMQENKIKQNALTEAMLAGHKEVVQIILASPHCQNNTRQQYKNYSLLLAVKNQDFAKVKELVEEGVSPEAVEYMGQTALSTAAKTGQADIFNYLVSNGAKINEYLLNPVINFINNAIEKANLVNEFNIPLATRLEVINTLYDYQTLLKDKRQQANAIEIASILDGLNKIMQALKAAKFSGPLLRLKLNISQESNTAAKMMEARYEEVLNLLSQTIQIKPQQETQLTRNNYIMEPIISFVKITSLKLEENNASPETRSMFQSFLQEAQDYVLNCKEDITDGQVIFKKLFPLVAAVNDKQNTHSFFAQKNSDLLQECRSVIEEVDKRIASSANKGLTN